MYLYSAALGVVVGLKESRRHGEGLESPGVEDMHDPGYVLLRISLARTRVNGALEELEDGLVDLAMPFDT
jgi:hypothetical protein